MDQFGNQWFGGLVLKVWGVRRRSIAEFWSLPSFQPEGSLLGIKLWGVDFRIWEESL